MRQSVGPERPPQELRVSEQVSTPELPRLGRQPAYPLEAVIRHPVGTAPDSAAHEVEQGPGGPHNGHVERTAMLGDPFFLSGRAHPDEQDVGPGPVDHSQSERSGSVPGRRSDDSQSRMTALKNSSGVACGAGRAAKEEQ